MTRNKVLTPLLIPSLCLLTSAAARANAPIPGDILLSDGNAHQIVEYSPSGAVVQRLAVPASDDSNRDLVVDSSGRIQVFNGTFSPNLATYAPATNAWTQRTYAGWSTVNNVTFGGIAAYQNYVYVTDDATAGNGSPSGIVRFNLTDNTAQRFSDGVDFIDLTLGQDNLLYGLEGSGSPSGGSINVYNPSTMSLIRTITLPGAVNSATSYANRSIAVNAQGDIFLTGLYGPIFHLDKNGNALKQTSYNISLYSCDLDLSASGKLMITEWDGHILMTDQSLNSVVDFLPPGNFSRGFATFVPGRTTPAPSALWVSGLGIAVLSASLRRRAKKPSSGLKPPLSFSCGEGL